jgi:hypothetical protein
VDYLYSLYDALVSINVPNDKARAVVDAMERDMGTTIATKADLQLLRQQIATKADFQLLRIELHYEFELIRKDLQIMSIKVTARFGWMLVVSFGILFAALKLT